jgi:hypothetical protein
MKKALVFAFWFFLMVFIAYIAIGVYLGIGVGNALPGPGELLD